MALVPGFFAGIYARKSYAAPPEGTQPTFRQALQDFRSPGAVLFALLLFFQFGNEWSIAGWLPLFLIRRVGLSPSGSLTDPGPLLAVPDDRTPGRRGHSAARAPRTPAHGQHAQRDLRLPHPVLHRTTAFGAAIGVFFVGAGFASIYPLVAEAIGRRFPYYHPGFFNGIFSFALVGGLLAPATLGYAASIWGVGVVIGIPLTGYVPGDGHPAR